MAGMLSMEQGVCPGGGGVPGVHSPSIDIGTRSARYNNWGYTLLV